MASFISDHCRQNCFGKTDGPEIIDFHNTPDHIHPNILNQALPKADRLYITEVKGTFNGDTYFPEFNINDWREISRIANSSDALHAFAFDFVIYQQRL